MEKCAKVKLNWKSVKKQKTKDSYPMFRIDITSMLQEFLEGIKSLEKGDPIYGIDPQNK